MLERLPSLIKDYEVIVKDYEGKNFNAKFINYLLEKYYGRKYGRNQELEGQTGITENNLKDMRNPYINSTVGTLLLFACGIGITLEEALVLAGEWNICWHGDNIHSRAIFETLLLLEDNAFRKMEPKTRINKSNIKYAELTEAIQDRASKRKKREKRREEKKNSIT